VSLRAGGNVILMRHASSPRTPPAGIAALISFVLLLVGLPLLQGQVAAPGVTLFNAFYRSGALVF